MVAQVKILVLQSALVATGHLPIAFDLDSLGHATAHLAHDRKDFADNAAAATTLAQNGHVVQVLEHRETGGKNPELLVNSEKTDLKTPDKPGKGGIKNAFQSA